MRPTWVKRGSGSARGLSHGPQRTHRDCPVRAARPGWCGASGDPLRSRWAVSVNRERCCDRRRLHQTSHTDLASLMRTVEDWWRGIAPRHQFELDDRVYIMESGGDWEFRRVRRSRSKPPDLTRGAAGPHSVKVSNLRDIGHVTDALEGSRALVHRRSARHRPLGESAAWGSSATSAAVCSPPCSHRRRLAARKSSRATSPASSAFRQRSRHRRPRRSASRLTSAPFPADGEQVIRMFRQVVDIQIDQPPPTAHPHLTPRQTEVLRLPSWAARPADRERAPSERQTVRNPIRPSSARLA